MLSCILHITAVFILALRGISVAQTPTLECGTRLPFSIEADDKLEVAPGVDAIGVAFSFDAQAGQILTIRHSYLPDGQLRILGPGDRPARWVAFPYRQYTDSTSSANQEWWGGTFRAEVAGIHTLQFLFNEVPLVHANGTVVLDCEFPDEANCGLEYAGTLGDPFPIACTTSFAVEVLACTYLAYLDFALEINEHSLVSLAEFDVPGAEIPPIQHGWIYRLNGAGEGIPEPLGDLVEGHLLLPKGNYLLRWAHNLGTGIHPTFVAQPEELEHRFVIDCVAAGAPDENGRFQYLFTDLWRASGLLGGFATPDFNFTRPTGAADVLEMKVTQPGNTFGFWENRHPFVAPEEGIYKLTVSIERLQDDQDSFASAPELRVRLHRRGALEQTMESLAVSNTETTWPKDKIEVLWRSDGISPWKVSIDLLSFRSEHDGGVRITSITNERVDVAD